MFPRPCLWQHLLQLQFVWGSDLLKLVKILDRFYLFIWFTVVCVHECLVYQAACVEIRGQLVGVCSFHLPSGLWGVELKSPSLAASATEQSCNPSRLLFSVKFEFHRKKWTWNKLSSHISSATDSLLCYHLVLVWYMGVLNQSAQFTSGFTFGIVCSTVLNKQMMYIYNYHMEYYPFSKNPLWSLPSLEPLIFSSCYIFFLP